MGSSYTNVKRIDDGPSKALKLAKLAILLIMISMSLAAIVASVKSSSSKDHDRSKPIASLHSLSDLQDKKSFKHEDLSARGSQRLLELECTKAIRISGHLIRGDITQPFYLTKKRPGQLLFKIDSGSHEMTIGVTSDTVWRRIRAPQQADMLGLIEAKEANSRRSQSKFLAPIITAIQGTESITTIGTDTCT